MKPVRQVFLKKSNMCEPCPFNYFPPRYWLNFLLDVFEQFVYYIKAAAYDAWLPNSIPFKFGNKNEHS